MQLRPLADLARGIDISSPSVQPQLTAPPPARTILTPGGARVAARTSKVHGGAFHDEVKRRIKD